MLLAHRPASPLASYVESLWYYNHGHQAASQRERVLPNGRFQLVIDLCSGGAAVSGMRSQYIEINPAAIQSAMGIVFKPGGAQGFLDGAAADFYNLVVPLHQVWGSRVAELQERLQVVVTATEKFTVLETALLEFMQRVPERRFHRHAGVLYALQEFRRLPHVRSVMDITKEAGLSRRRLSQLFREQVGITPKLYCRLVRFRQVVRQIAAGGRVDWADVALAGG